MTIVSWVNNDLCRLCGLCVWMCRIALERLFWGAVWLCEERSRTWSHGVVERLLCEVVCRGVRDGAAETLLTGVKVVPETMYLGKSSIGGDIAHIGDWFVFSCVDYIIRFIGISSSTMHYTVHQTMPCTYMRQLSESKSIKFSLYRLQRRPRHPTAA